MLVCGTTGYMAPEMNMGNHSGYYATKADVFALGVMLFMMVNGRLPFVDSNPNIGWYRKLLLNKE